MENIMTKYFKECLEDLEIPKDWVDCSYTNDTCPSFSFDRYQIFIEHRDPKRWEVEGKRFRVILEFQYGQSDYFFDCDTMQEVLENIDSHKNEEVVKLVETEDNKLGFDFGGCYWITDPLSSTCGRFEVNPQREYGLTKKQVKQLIKHNKLEGKYE